MYLVLSCSLDPESKSRLLAKRALEELRGRQVHAELIDLRDRPLPFCDGATAFAHPDVAELSKAISRATGVLIATPIYNFDANAVLKNLVELTGRNAWQDQVVGFLCAAGGKASYMSIMSLANSLMLDFRTFIVPRFVYADGSSFTEDAIDDDAVEVRIAELADSIIQVASALKTAGTT